MIMMGDKKRMVSEILGPPEGIPKDESGKDQELKAIAGELVQAVHMKDETAVADALKAAYECLTGQHDY